MIGTGKHLDREVVVTTPCQRLLDDVDALGNRHHVVTVAKQEERGNRAGPQGDGRIRLGARRGLRHAAAADQRVLRYPPRAAPPSRPRPGSLEYVGTKGSQPLLLRR